MAKKRMATGAFIKSTAIKALARSTGKRGKPLAAALKDKHPGEFADYDVERLAGYCSTVLSQAKANHPKKPNGQAPRTQPERGHSPFMSQLKHLTSLIGKQAVKDMVDKI